MAIPVSSPGAVDPDELLTLSLNLALVCPRVLDGAALINVAELVASLAIAALADTFGASITVTSDGQLSTLSATVQTIATLDAVQYQARCGPCVEATTTGLAQHATGSNIGARWPAFGAAVSDHDIASMLSIPIFVNDGGVGGALNLYGRSVGTFDATDTWRAFQFATHLGVVLHHLAG